MKNVAEIEQAIGNLSPAESNELYTWMDRNSPLDLQLKADLEAGLIDDRIERAVADREAGGTRPL